VGLYDTTNGEAKGKPFAAHQGEVLCIALGPSGAYVLTGMQRVEAFRATKTASGAASADLPCAWARDWAVFFLPGLARLPRRG
jgi:hypothetical protein